MPVDETNTETPNGQSGSVLVRMPSKAETATLICLTIGVGAQLADAFPEAVAPKVNAVLGLLWAAVRMYAMVTGRKVLVSDANEFAQEVKTNVLVGKAKKPL